MVTSDAIPEQLFVQVRGDDATALGLLLELFRNDLKPVARSIIDGGLK